MNQEWNNYISYTPKFISHYCPPDCPLNSSPLENLDTQSMKTLLFMFIITFLIKPFQLSTVYFVLFLYFLAKKDYETMYIEKYWVFPSILLLFFCSSYVPLLNRVCTSLVFLFVSGTIKLIKSDWIGSADVCYLTFFGFYLGIERMLVALYISVLLGILWILYKKTHLIN